MRWDGLFADLEAQLSQAAWQETEAEAAELTRGETAGVHLVDRLRGAVGHDLTLRLTGGDRLEIRVSTVGPSWIGGTDGAGAVLVPLSSVSLVEHRLPVAAAERSASARVMGIGSVFRSLARSRMPIALVGVEGSQLAEGTIDRVGADHLDLALHARDEIRRRDAVRGVAVVPFTAVGYVRSAQASDF